jgi:rSAM/selenodomain-associated transferase 2
MNNISVIIPIYNEAKIIDKLLQYLYKASSKEIVKEIIVVDGGSTDNSIEIVSSFKKVLLVRSDKGRAKQMNAGANKASCSVLYFLHADSFPPMGFDQLIINEMENGYFAGCFCMKFNSNHWWLKLAGWFTKFSWPICRGGDQSLFIQQSLFYELGGYDENYIIYEDNVFIKKLYKKIKFKVIQKPLLTSARLYEKHGILKLQYHFFVIHLKHWFGASPESLYNYYANNIA